MASCMTCFQHSS